MYYEDELKKLINNVYDNFIIMHDANAPRMPSSLFFEKNDMIIKLKFYNNTSSGLEKAVSDYNYVNYILSYNRPYIAKTYDSGIIRNCMFTITKKYLELDSEFPYFSHYNVEYLIKNNLMMSFLDTIYDMWKHGFYIEDRLPSRNICKDEQENIIHIDFDINMERYESCKSDTFSKFRFFETISEDDKRKINLFLLTNFGKSIDEYFE